MAEESKSSNGISLTGVVFLIFLVLKLGGWGVVATWSWWWVTSPLWLPLAIVLIIALIVALFL